MTDASDHKRTVAGMFDRSADTYDTTGADFFGPAGHDLVALAAIAPGERVLDVGCGRGAVLFPAAGAVGADGQVTGVDLSPRMVALTGGDAARRGLTQVTVRRGDAEWPVPDGAPLDAVLAGFVLFFLPDPAPALHRYRALLRGGGRVGFSTFAAPDAQFEAAMRAVLAFVPGGQVERDQRQGRLASPESIAELVTETGYRGVRTEDRYYDARFRDFEQWTTWVWSHGGRGTLEQVPPEALPSAYDAARAALEPARVGVGFTMRTGVRFTVATT